MCRNMLGQPIQIPQQFTIGINQEEIYDPEVHSDVPDDPELVLMNPDTGDFYVENRWKTLLSPVSHSLPSPAYRSSLL